MRYEPPGPYPQGYVRSSEIEIMRQLLPLTDARVLELGCGSAQWTRRLAEGFPIRSLVATEVDRIQHEKNLQIDDLPQVSFRYGGAEAIDLPDASVDIVVMLKSLHHVPMELMDQALREIHRVLVPDGFAYISEPVYAGDFNEILRLFNDEKEVRRAAFAAVTQAVESGLFRLAGQHFFLGESRFADFGEFDRRILSATHSDFRLDAALRHQVQAAFEAHIGAEGAVFWNPNRVDLLRKNQF